MSDCRKLVYAVLFGLLLGGEIGQKIVNSVTNHRIAVLETRIAKLESVAGGRAASPPCTGDAPAAETPAGGSP